jgi:hypothetical protein
MDIKGLLKFGKQAPEKQLSRSESKQLIKKNIAPLLKKENFNLSKDTSFWRINEVTTDILKARFLTETECLQFSLPQSSFSVLFGCYFHFIPSIESTDYIYQIDRIITPREESCHLRFSAIRGVKQKPSKMDQTVWHLSEENKRLQEILNDVKNQIISNIVPKLNRLSLVDNWIRLLEDKNFNNIGVGKTNSLQRNFLAGFTYKHNGNKKRALSHLLSAQKIAEEQLNKVSKYTKNLTNDAPIFAHLKLINSALNELKI